MLHYYMCFLCIIDGQRGELVCYSWEVNLEMCAEEVGDCGEVRNDPGGRRGHL